MTGVVLDAWAGRTALRLPLRAVAVAVGLVCAIAAVLIVSLMSGPYRLGPAEVINTLLGDAPDRTATAVIWEFRFPRTLAAFLVGGFLAMSGATLQYVTRNPLADPSLVGVSQGAALVVVAVTVLVPGFGLYWRPVLAMAGALSVAAVILTIASARRGGETLRFILTGIGVAALISSFTQALLTYGDIDRSISALGWLSGSVHTAGWDEVSWLAITAVIAVPGLLGAARPLSALRFGEEVAISLGIRVVLARWVLVALSVGLAATAVAAVGPLGFVGLVAPHLARRLAPSGVAMHLVLTGLTGALMVGLADLAGRTVFAPVQIPAGLFTAVLGVPVFVFLILRSQARNPI